MNIIKCNKCGAISPLSHGTPEGWVGLGEDIICLECRLKKLEEMI